MEKAVQEIKVVARTFEVTDDTTEKMNHDLTLLSGKAAGVCYMTDDYTEKGIQDEDKAMKRASNTAKSGHHSVFDHGHITMVIKTNKMMAMVLNSLGVYTTSEKSARYTKMQPETELELQLYTKWQKKIQQLILKNYPDMDDDILSTRLCKKMGIEKSQAVVNGSTSHIKDDEFLESELNELKKSETLPSYKLAQENARYMLSVFTPTTMEYTISYRQLFLTMDYLYKLVVDCDYIKDNIDSVYKENNDKNLQFIVPLRYHANELWKQFDEMLTNAPVWLCENKNQYIKFLEAQHVGELMGITNRKYVPYTDMDKRMEQKRESFGDSYTTVYTGSLAMMAQAQRHRTLKYTMNFTNTSEYGFYVPPIIEKEGLKEEWLADMESVSYCIPQGTLVRITEQGTFEDFVLKCKERLCGRAQLEVALQSKVTMMHFMSNKSNLCYTNRQLMDNVTAMDARNAGMAPCARCQFKDFTCQEGCRWGAKEALTRLV